MGQRKDPSTDGVSKYKGTTLKQKINGAKRRHEPSPLSISYELISDPEEGREVYLFTVEGGKFTIKEKQYKLKREGRFLKLQTKMGRPTPELKLWYQANFTTPEAFVPYIRARHNKPMSDFHKMSAMARKKKNEARPEGS